MTQGPTGSVATRAQTAFGAAGGSHSTGLVPDPGATAHDPAYVLGDDTIWRRGGAMQNKYHPARSPGAAAGAIERWPGNVALLTWRWGNQGTATETVQNDAAYVELTGAQTSNLRVRWTTVTNSGDWVISMFLYGIGFSSSGDFAGLALLETGTEATPTSLLLYGMHNNGGTLGLSMLTMTSYTSAMTLVAQTASVWNTQADGAWCQVRYKSSTKTVNCWRGGCGLLGGGYAWIQVGTDRVLGVAPQNSSGYAINSTANSAHAVDGIFPLWQQRTDATGIAVPYPPGS